MILKNQDSGFTLRRLTGLIPPGVRVPITLCAYLELHKLPLGLVTYHL
jgi:hypothetical protein